MPLLRLFLLSITKTLTKVFGLATVSLFGRTPSRDADKMAIIGLLALSWLPVVVAIAVPDAAEAMIPGAPDDDTLLRAIAIATAIALPVIVGVMVSRLHNHRGLGGGHTAREMVRGFRYTPIIGLVTTAVLLVLPFLAASRVLRSWEVGRTMVLIGEGQRDEAVDHIRDTLTAAGHETEPKRAPRIVHVLFRWLGHVLGDIFRLDVAPDLTVLSGRDREGDEFELTIHAADLTIIGPQAAVTRVHATLAEDLDLRCIGITWDDLSRDLEQRIGQLRDDLDAGEQVPLERIDELVLELDGTALEAEPWSALRRALHRLERDVLRARVGAEQGGPPTGQVEAGSSER